MKRIYKTKGIQLLFSSSRCARVSVTECVYSWINCNKFVLQITTSFCSVRWELKASGVQRQTSIWHGVLHTVFVYTIWYAHAANSICSSHTTTHKLCQLKVRLPLLPPLTICKCCHELCCHADFESLLFHRPLLYPFAESNWQHLPAHHWCSMVTWVLRKSLANPATHKKPQGSHDGCHCLCWPPKPL